MTTMPPINQRNYTAHRDWFDNSRWLRQHRSTTANRVQVARVESKKPIDFIKNR